LSDEDKTMGITVTWDNDAQTVLRYGFGEHWQWDDFKKAFRQAQQMLASVGHMVDVIADFQNSACVPTETLARLAYVAASRPPNLGNSVIVGSKVFDTTTFTVFGHFYGDTARTYHVTHSLDRARALLAKAGLHYPLPERTRSA
jgi:hypothetical protein